MIQKIVLALCAIVCFVTYWYFRAALLPRELWGEDCAIIFAFPPLMLFAGSCFGLHKLTEMKPRRAVA